MPRNILIVCSYKLGEYTLFFFLIETNTASCGRTTVFQRWSTRSFIASLPLSYYLGCTNPTQLIDKETHVQRSWNHSNSAYSIATRETKIKLLSVWPHSPNTIKSINTQPLNASEESALTPRVSSSRNTPSVNTGAKHGGLAVGGLFPFRVVDRSQNKQRVAAAENQPPLICPQSAMGIVREVYSARKDPSFVLVWQGGLLRN